MSQLIDDELKIRVDIWDHKHYGGRKKEEEVIEPFVEFVENLEDDSSDWTYVFTVCSEKELKKVFGVELSDGNRAKVLMHHITEVKYGVALGSGSYGKVYSAYFPAGEKVFLAIKQVRGLHEFKGNELKILARLKPPASPKFYGAYYYKGDVYIVMEYIDGITGTEFGKEYGHDTPKCLELCKQLLLVINYLHNRQIAHFDIKPDNMIVTMNRNRLKVTLVDMGFAYQLSKRESLDERFGTRWYFSPQVARAADVNKKADVWSAITTVMAIILSDKMKGPVPPLKICKPELSNMDCITYLKCEIRGPEELISCLPEYVDEHIRDLFCRGLGVRLKDRSGPRKLLTHRAFSRFKEDFTALQKFLNKPACCSESLSDFATDNCLEIIDFPLDGNCLFNALADQMEVHLAIKKTGLDYRREIIQHLKENRRKADGILLAPFLDNNAEWEKYKKDNVQFFKKMAGHDWSSKQNHLCRKRWKWYINYMNQDGSFGDSLVIWAASQLYNVDIKIISALDTHFVIRSESQNPRRELVFGYCQRLHFVSLSPLLVPGDSRYCQFKPTAEYTGGELSISEVPLPLVIEDMEAHLRIDQDVSKDERIGHSRNSQLKPTEGGIVRALSISEVPVVVEDIEHHPEIEQVASEDKHIGNSRDSRKDSSI